MNQNLIWKKLKKTWVVFKDGWEIFTKNEPVKFGASIAYFTIFSLPPTFLIMIYLSSIILEDAFITGEIFSRLREIFGEDGALLLRYITSNLEAEAYNWWQVIMLVSVVLFLSTSLFRLIQASLNKLWRIKTVIKGGLRQFLYTRLFLLSSSSSLKFRFFRKPIWHGP